MGDIGDIKNTLLDSCKELHSHKEQILDNTLLDKCKSIFEDNYNESIKNVNEQKIFGVNRNNKIEHINTFINNINDVLKKIFENIKEDRDTDKMGYTELNNKYSDVLKSLQVLMQEMIDNINDNNSKLYYKKEGSQYTQLLNNYNKIENNRYKLDELSNNYISLNNINNIENDKINNESNSNKKIFIFLVIFFILMVILNIYIIFFMKI
jgi:hypothetical protein